MLILSTLKPWGASLLSSLSLNNQTNRHNLPKHLCKPPASDPKAHANVQLQKLALHQPPFSHLPLEMHKAWNTHFNTSTCTHTYSCLCLHAVWVIGYNLIKRINKLWAVMSRGVRPNKHITGWAVYLCEDNCGGSSARWKTFPREQFALHASTIITPHHGHGEVFHICPHKKFRFKFWKGEL